MSTGPGRNRFIFEEEETGFDLPAGYQATIALSEGILPG